MLEGNVKGLRPFDSRPYGVPLCRTFMPPQSPGGDSEGSCPLDSRMLGGLRTAALGVLLRACARFCPCRGKASFWSCAVPHCQTFAPSIPRRGTPRTPALWTPGCLVVCGLRAWCAASCLCSLLPLAGQGFLLVALREGFLFPV